MDLRNLNIDKNTMNELMKSAQEMQKKMQWVQETLSGSEVVGEAGAGAVKLTMNGRYVAKKLRLEPSVYREPKEVVEDLVVAAINDATRKVEKLSQEKLMQLSKELGYPGPGSGDAGAIGGGSGIGGAGTPMGYMGSTEIK